MKKHLSILNFGLAFQLAVLYWLFFGNVKDALATQYCYEVWISTSPEYCDGEARNACLTGTCYQEPLYPKWDDFGGGGPCACYCCIDS